MPTTSVQATSADAYYAIDNKRRGQRHAQILDVMLTAQRNGTRNLTTTEIVQRLQQAYPDANWHPGNASARISELATTDGPLMWCEATRLCTVSGSNRQCRPLMLRPVQERLVA